jgi:ABC-type multidrug transport system fused ATPase/permease subunit
LSIDKLLLFFGGRKADAHDLLQKMEGLMSMTSQIKARLDENLIFIWEELMSEKARSFAQHALFRVLIGSALLIVMPYAIGFLIDGISGKQTDVLLIGGALYFSIKLTGIVVGWWRQQVRERFFQEEFWYLPQAITALYLKRPLAWLSGGTSEIDGGGVDSLRDKVWNVINSYIFQIIPGYAQIVFALLACSYANVLLGLIALSYIVAERYVGSKETAYIYREMKPVIDQFKRWDRRMQEWWRNADHVKSQGVETKLLIYICSEVQKALRADDAVWRVYFAKAIAKHRARDLMFGMMLYVGIVYLTFTGVLSLAVAVLVFFSFERISSVLGDLNDQQRDVQFNLSSIAKYKRVLEKSPPFIYNEGKDFTAQDISILFDQVSHEVVDSKGDGKLVLRDVTLDIPVGQKVGIVGPSGAGKSQLLSLLTRATDPIAGTVRINGEDLRELKLESLLRYYGVIMQKSEPYEDTILGNLLFGVSHLDLPTPYEELSAHEQATICGTAYRSLEKAGLNVEAFDNGLFTNIGYKGLTLSGGQQQRLQIAAAHMKLNMSEKRPRLVIADEPTASLDSLSELKVMAHLQDNLPEGTTLLMVAHRLSTVANMDKIVFVRPIELCSDGRPQVIVYDSLTEAYRGEALFREMADAQKFVPEGIMHAA